MEIYLDILFLINAVMDYLILTAAGAIIRKKQSRRRCLIFSCLYAAAGIILIITDFPLPLRMLLKLLLPLILVFFYFRKCSWTEWLKRSFILLCVQFLTAGLMRGVLSVPGGIRGAFEKNGLTYFYYDDGRFIGALLLTALAVRLFCDFISHRKRFYQLELSNGGTTCRTTALYDSGNSLREPHSQKPVIIAERSILAQLNCAGASKFFLPFVSLGNQHGLMEVIKIDRLRFVKENKSIDQVLIGISDAPLSPGGRFHILLHKDFDL